MYTGYIFLYNLFFISYKKLNKEKWQILMAVPYGLELIH